MEGSLFENIMQISFRNETKQISDEISKGYIKLAWFLNNYRMYYQVVKHNQ